MDGKGGPTNLKLRGNKKLRPVLDMLTNHSHVEVMQNKPTVLQWINGLTKGETENLCDPCDQCDHLTGTVAKNLEGNSSNSVNISSADRNEKAARDSIKRTKNISQLDSRAHKSHRSQSITDEIEEPTLYSCYHKGCNYHTDDVQEYERHGAQKHLKNPLLYPSKAEIEKYGLKAQGKDWEI